MEYIYIYIVLYLSIYLSTYLPIYLSIYLSIYIHASTTIILYDMICVGCIHKKRSHPGPKGMAIGYLLGKINGSGVYSTKPGEKNWFLGEGLVFPSWVKLPKNVFFLIGNMIHI